MVEMNDSQTRLVSSAFRIYSHLSPGSIGSSAGRTITTPPSSAAYDIRNSVTGTKTESTESPASTSLTDVDLRTTHHSADSSPHKSEIRASNDDDRQQTLVDASGRGCNRLDSVSLSKQDMDYQPAVKLFRSSQQDQSPLCSQPDEVELIESLTQDADPDPDPNADSDQRSETSSLSGAGGETPTQDEHDGSRSEIGVPLGSVFSTTGK